MQGPQKQIEKIIMIISLLIFLAAPAAMADSGSLSATKTSMSAEKKKSIPLETDFTLSTCYRVDELDWNIAGDINGNNPNVLSELAWDDVESYQLKFQGSLVWPNIIALRGSEMKFGIIQVAGLIRKLSPPCLGFFVQDQGEFSM